MIKGDESRIPVGKWQTNLERYAQVIPPCQLINLRLIMMSFIHKEIQNQHEFRKSKLNVQELIANHIFFHNRLLERWLAMCSYEVVAKDVSFESTVDKLSAEVSKMLDNVFIIFDEEVTGDDQKHLNIYVYDGNFIRDSFEKNC